MHRIFRVKAYEAEHGPHFNEEHARKAVSKMENEDGTHSAMEKLKSLLYLRINQLLLIVHQVLLYLQINRKL